MVKSNNKFLFYRILVFSLFSLVFLILSFCSTEPQTGSLSGTILLDGQEDNSGITVALYELTTLDPDIVAINEEYDFIGVIINQMTEFDHRFATLTKYTQTDTYGNFKIKDIPTGRYNVVALKDSFGFHYVYEVTITEGENYLKMKEQRLKIKEKNLNPESDENDFNLSYNFNLSSLVFSLNNRSAITLFPETIISSDIDTPTTWYYEHHYIIEDDIFVSGALTIEPGAIVRLNEGVKLTISGDLNALGNEENMIWFTSNDLSRRSPDSFLGTKTDSLISLYPYIPYTFNRVELTGSLNKQVSFCKFDNAGTGLLNKVNGFSILDCIFRNSSCGFKSENVDSTFCSNLLCEDITSASYAGIYFENQVSGYIKNSIFNNCNNGIKIKDNSNPEIYNNYFCINEIGAELWSSFSSFKYNELVRNSIDLRVCGPTSPEIRYNNFNSNLGIYIGLSYAYRNATPEIHKNNLDNDVYSIYVCKHNSHNINALNNYFYTITESEINSLIFDKNDVEPSLQQYYGIVFYQPFLTQEYPYAGIQGE